VGTLRSEARDAGATEILAKPCTPKAIYARLAAIVERPRPFVKSPSYAGPDRRRRIDTDIPRERRADSHEID
jgi:two-component system chemotaxis response regulator CheY